MDQPKSRPIQRELARCATCAAWWSVLPLDDGGITETCGCGGKLVIADMDAHRERLPYVPHVPPTKTT